MRRLVFIYIKAWTEHYDEENGDGTGKKFYEWCVRKYLPEGVEELLEED
jgi:hypothetical protein